MDAFTLVAKLTLSRSEFDQGLKQVEGSMNSNETKGAFSAWGVTVGNLAAQAFTKVFRAGVNFMKSVLTTGMDFDQMMSSVKAIGNMGEQEFERVRQKAIDLGASTKFTAEEVGEAFYYMGLAGWNTEEMLAGIEGVLNLAAASGENLGSVSDIVTDAITAMGLSADDTARFVNVLAAASTNSNTTVGMMGEAFKYLATTGGVLEYSIEDVATVLGLLANNGIKATQAGTSMRQILNTLINPSKDAAAAMEKLGLSLFDPKTNARKPLGQVVEEMRQIFKDAGLQLKEGFDAGELQTRLDKLNDWYDKEYEKIEQMTSGKKKALKELDKAYKERFADEITPNKSFLASLGDIGGLRGISSLFALMNSTDDDVKQLVDAVNKSGEGKGTAAEMATIMLDNLKGDVTILNSAIDGLKIAMFDEINPAARDFVQYMTDGVTAITNLIKHGKLTWTVEDEEREAINDAERSAIEASGLVDYMDSLIEKYGEAATSSAGWADAMKRLEELIPGITAQIQKEGQALSDTTANMRDYITESRNKAIEDAKRATIAKYTEQYNEAQAALGQAQIDQYIAEAEAGAARTALVEYVRKTQGASFTGQNMSFDQLEAAAYATANELGESTEYIKTLSDSYKTQTQIAEDNKKSIEELTISSNRLKTQLDIANKAVEQMVRDMQSSVSSTTMTYGQYANEYYSKHSHAKGDWYIPYDDYPAMLHRGEMVLTASQARQFREGYNQQIDVPGLTAAIVSAVQEGMAKAHVTAYMDGRKVTNEVSRRMNGELMLAR